MMVEPEFADDDEADHPGEEFQRQFEERFDQLADAGMVGDRGDFSSSTSSVTTMANTPSLKASRRLRRRLTAGEAGEEGHMFALSGSA